MKEILSAFEEKHGQDENALPIVSQHLSTHIFYFYYYFYFSLLLFLDFSQTNQGQKLLAKAERQLVRLQQQRLNGSPMATIPGSPDLELRSPSPVVYTGSYFLFQYLFSPSELCFPLLTDILRIR